jgi:hypothetical protein
MSSRLVPLAAELLANSYMNAESIRLDAGILECSRNSTIGPGGYGAVGPVKVDGVPDLRSNGVRVSGLSFWSDPIWKGLRIVSFVSATVTVVLLVMFFSGHRSWRVPLDTAIVVNIAVFAALIIRTVIVRAKLHRASKS